MSQKIDLYDMRSKVYFDWSVRDILQRSIIHLYENGHSLEELEELVRFITRKIWEDFKHLKTLLELAEYLKRKGYQVILVEQRNKLADLIILAEHETILVEVKATAPPWCGMNKEEYEKYKNMKHTVYYVWKDVDGWWYTTPDKIKIIDKCVHPQFMYPLD